MNPITPTFSITDTGFFLSADHIDYVMTWVDGMLKVTGPDTCYYLMQTVRGLEQANCTLTTFSLLVSN